MTPLALGAVAKIRYAAAGHNRHIAVRVIGHACLNKAPRRMTLRHMSSQYFPACSTTAGPDGTEPASHVQEPSSCSALPALGVAEGCAHAMAWGPQLAVPKPARRRMIRALRLTVARA